MNMSRDEELLAQHIREAMPGTLAVVLIGELHSMLREERQRWAAEIAAQNKEWRRAAASARAEGFARAREMASEKAKAIVLELVGCTHVSTSDGDDIARDIRAMQDDTGEGT